MHIQNSALKLSFGKIRIPSTKRYNSTTEYNSNASSNSTVFSENPFELFKSQLQEPIHQLALRPQKSGFTKVSAKDSDQIENIGLQNAMIIFKNQQASKYEQSQLQLKRLIILLSKESDCQQKQEKQQGLNTKNILRNICNAQNQYILFNLQAFEIIKTRLQNPNKFMSWVNKLRLHTFQQFQKVWNIKKMKNIYCVLYKRLCRKFYHQNAIPYILNSRIKNRQTKVAHVRYLYRFLQGLEDPKGFYYFKQKESEKQRSD